MSNDGILIRIANALERIADALENMPVCPPVNIPSVWTGDPVYPDYTTTSGTTDECNETITYADVPTTDTGE